MKITDETGWYELGDKDTCSMEAGSSRRAGERKWRLRDACKPRCGGIGLDGDFGGAARKCGGGASNTRRI